MGKIMFAFNNVNLLWISKQDLAQNTNYDALLCQKEKIFASTGVYFSGCDRSTLSPRQTLAATKNHPNVPFRTLPVADVPS